MELIRSHDALFRFVFGEPEQMRELLRACLPSAITDNIDWSSLRRVPGSFVDKALKGRRTDLLFTVRMGNARLLLYVVPEHKSKDERYTTWQIAGYVMRIVDQWRSAHADAGGLPAVLPFVLYHGEAPWRSPRSPHELVDFRGCHPELAQFLKPLQMQLPFFLVDLSRFDEARIESLRVSAVTGLTLRFLQFLRSCPPEQAGVLIRSWQHLVQRLLDHPRGEDVLNALLLWYIANQRADPDTLRTVMTKIREENPPMRSCLDLLLELNEERGFKKGERLGRKLGQKRGEKRGKLLALRTVLEGLLHARFGDLPARVRDRISTGSADALQGWSLRVVTAQRIDDVFAND